MLKPKIKAQTDKMVARMDATYADGVMIFLSTWNKGEDAGAHSFIQGDSMIVERCFREMQPIMRRLERCNVNPSPRSEEELQKVIADLAEEGDPEIISRFQEISELLLDGDPAADVDPYCGQALIMVGWMELGISFHRYVESVGMVRGIVGLFNAATDSFRKTHPSEGEQL